MNLINSAWYVGIVVDSSLIVVIVATIIYCIAEMRKARENNQNKVKSLILLTITLSALLGYVVTLMLIYIITYFLQKSLIAAEYPFINCSWVFMDLFIVAVLITTAVTLGYKNKLLYVIIILITLIYFIFCTPLQLRSFMEIWSSNTCI